MSLTAFRHYLCMNPRYLSALLRQKIRMRQRCGWIDRCAGTGADTPPPLVYKFILTGKCNLACKMCMNIVDRDNRKSGFVRDDFDTVLFKRIVDQIDGTKASVILSGGEPMLHCGFGDCISMLEEKRIATTVCTNGTMLMRHAPLLASTKHVSLIVSLDGIREVNDAIRGDGVFDEAVSGIRHLRMKRKSLYIGIQHTIQPENAATMYRFCSEMTALKVDWILLNPCWHMSREQADYYCAFMKKTFDITPHGHEGYIIEYPLDTELFAQQYRRIKNAKWPVQISCYFNNPVDDMRRMLADPAFFSGNRFCYKQWIRMDIMPDGKVVSCQQFPDIVVGDLLKERCSEIWNGKRLKKFRDVIMQGPLPVCNKCAPLYLYDGNRRSL